MTTVPSRPRKSAEPSPLLTVRAALILALAVLVGIGAGVLTVIAGGVLAAAILTGCMAAGGSLKLFSDLIGT